MEKTSEMKDRGEIAAGRRKTFKTGELDLQI
jgi:hypothetical protein